MDNGIISDIFNILKLTQEEKTKTLKDLDSLIKARLTSNLIERLPIDKMEKIKDIQGTENQENQKVIASIIEANYTVEQIEKEKKIAIGQTILIYIDFIFQKLGTTEKEEIKRVLVKYDIKI